MHASSVQLEIRDEPKAATVERMIAKLDQTRGSDLVLLPELWPTGYFAFDRYASDAEALDGPTVTAIRERARKLKTWIFGGSLVERDGGKLYNTSVLIDGSGTLVARYRKMHLFGYGSEERKALCAGSAPAVAETPWGRAGLATCYDLRFPELFRAMVDRGAQMFLVASAWPAARVEPWRLFNRARALENQSWLLSCNCAGSSVGKALAGNSHIVDPWGEVLARGSEGEEIVSADIAPQRAEAARREFPALADRVLGAGTSDDGLLPAFDPATLRKFTDGVPYQSAYETGLYPGASNERPAAHAEAGRRLAASIQPLDPDGRPDAPRGKVLAIVMGHSNCQQYFAEFLKFMQPHYGEMHPRFEILNCAVGGQQLHELLNDEKRPVWRNIDELTSRPGYSRDQVQVLFLHTTYHTASNRHRFSSEPFPERYRQMRHDVETLLARVTEHCPNLKLAYLTADGFRHHTGFEPHVYREAFGIKWAIERQINGAEGTAFEGAGRRLPWLTWGPYLWDNSWDASYFTDGVHPADKARKIFCEKYWQFLSEDPVTKAWLFPQAGQH